MNRLRRLIKEPSTGIAEISAYLDGLDHERRMRALADPDAHVLLRGETGSGRELLARTLHLSGPHRPHTESNQQLPRRHLLCVNPFEQQAFIGLARDNSRTRFTTPTQGFARVQHQAATNLLCVRRMTFVAVLDQHRADFLFEKI